MSDPTTPPAGALRGLPREAAVFFVVVLVAAMLLELLLDDANFSMALIEQKLLWSAVATVIYAAVVGWKRWKASR